MKAEHRFKKPRLPSAKMQGEHGEAYHSRKMTAAMMRQTMQNIVLPVSSNPSPSLPLNI